MGALKKLMIVWLNFQLISAAPLSNTSSATYTWSDWDDNNGTARQTTRLETFRLNESTAPSSDVYEANDFSKIQIQTERGSSYNAPLKILKLGTFNISDGYFIPSFKQGQPVSVPESVQREEFSQKNRTVIKMENFKHQDYTTRISLRNTSYFFCQRDDADCGVVLIPPSKFHGIRVTILRLNLRLQEEISPDFQTRKRAPYDGHRLCRDYLQFKEGAEEPTVNDGYQEICGEISSFTNGAEKLIGKHYYMAKPGQNVTVSFHRGRDNLFDTLLGTTWDLYFNNGPGIGGELLVSTYTQQDGLPSIPTLPPRRVTPLLPKYDFPEFVARRPPFPSQTPVPDSSNWNSNSDSDTESWTSPFHLAWWVVLIIIVIFLNFFALICKRMREMDAPTRRPSPNDRSVRRITLRNSFTMPSQLLQRFTEPSVAPARRSIGIRTILGLPSSVSVPPRSSSPPPIYPGPAADPYLPSYESLFDTKDNKNVPLTASPVTSVTNPATASEPTVNVPTDNSNNSNTNNISRY